MAAPRLTPHQKLVLERLAEGLVIRGLDGWERLGLFRPGSRSVERSAGVFIKPETVEIIADRLQAFDARTGTPIPMPSSARRFGVEYRLAQPEGGAL